jgi:hypothetical protein
MRRTFAIGVTLLVGLVVASPTGAATPTERKLQRQLAAVQKQVKTLQRQVKTLQRQVDSAGRVAVGAVAYTVCSTAVTVDAFQGTWSTMNAFAGRALFPATAPQLSDQIGNRGACEGYRVTRAPTAVPPGITVFDSLLKIFR